MPGGNKERWNDRHRIIRPNDGTNVGSSRGGPTNTVLHAGFLNGLSNRIGDLFRTQAGLGNHLPPVQDALRSLRNADGSATVDFVVDRVVTALKRAGDAASFDFGSFTLDVDAHGSSIQIVCGRTNGVT